jgi:hypothetical protein
MDDTRCDSQRHFRDRRNVRRWKRTHPARLVKTILACAILLSGCVYRISPGDVSALGAQPVQASSRVEVTQKRGPPQGFQCFEPLLAALSLGLIPVNCVDTFSVSVTQSDGETAQGTYTSSMWMGWIALLMGPLPNWHWQPSTGEGGTAKEIERRVREGSK